MGGELLVYGSYGYTGSLIARRAVAEGMSPILAGRRAEPVERQATMLDCDHRVFSLDHPAIVEEAIEDADVLVNCAGPFADTARSLVEACLRTGTEYLDITGEYRVLESIAERDREAERAEITLLPGVGFTVAVTDCLAALLDAELSSATHLELGVDHGGTASAGTAKSGIEGLRTPGAVREQGAIREVPAAWRRREIDFGDGPRTAVTIPTGDVSTAYYSTGIPNVETYVTVPERAAWAMERTRWATPILAAGPVQRLLKRTADVLVSPPSSDDRAAGGCRVWGEVVDDDGNVADGRLRTPDPFDVTTDTAVEAARRVLDGDVSPGFQTPASAFGPSFALELDGIEVEGAVAYAGVE